MWRIAFERRGLKVSRSKTENLCLGQKENRPGVRMADDDITEANEFKYLGSTIHGDGRYDVEFRRVLFRSDPRSEWAMMI